MIVRKADDGALLLRQEDHARLCGPWARAWRFDLPRREETAEAAAFHDNGWRERDARPRVAPDGSAYDYRSIPPDDYRELWARGFERAWQRGSWIGLFVSRHGTGFLRADDAATRALVARERERQARAQREHGLASAEAQEVEQVIRFLDGLSLFLCERWPSPWRAATPAGELVVARADEERATVEPWPFAADRLAAQAPATFVARDRWRDDAELRADFARGERRMVRWELLPPSPQRLID